MEGVSKELLASGFSDTQVQTYVDLFRGLKKTNSPLNHLGNVLRNVLKQEVYQGLKEIIASVLSTVEGGFEVLFDPTLVRGMSYYTGTIFEIEMPEFGSSVAGGGRYDEMIGKFTGTPTPACGFSVGFERIVTILLDQNYQIPDAGKKIAFLVDKKLSTEELCKVIAQAQTDRANGTQVLVARMNKNKKFQKEQLTTEGYTEFQEFYSEPLK